MLSNTNSIDFLKSLEELCCNWVDNQPEILKSDKARKKTKLKKNLLIQFFSFLFTQHLEKQCVLGPKAIINKEKITKPNFDIEKLQNKISVFSFT